MKKKFRSWCFLSFGITALFSGVFLSLFFISGVVNADSLTNYEKARANLSVRILAKDLSICHANLQDTINVTKSAGTSFSTSTYWKKPKNWVALPTIFDNTENKQKPNCYEIITGWQKENNFFNKLLTVLSAGGYASAVDWSKKADFPGVDTSVALPGVDNNNNTAESNVEQMKQFLEGSKFQKTSTGSSSQLNGYRCVYFEMSANGSVWEKISYPGPPSNALISYESFCVAVDGNGNLDTSKNPIVMGEYDNKGNAVIRERKEGASYIGLMPTGDNEFKWDTRAAGAKHYLGIHIDYIKGWWDEATSGNYNNIEIKNYQDGKNFVSQCYNNILGIGYRCELTDEANKKANIPAISFDTFKSRLTQYVASLQAKENMFSDNSYKLFSSVVAKELDTDTYSYQKGNVDDFVKYFFNQNGDKIIDNGKYALRTEEKYMFYYDHLKKYFNVTVNDDEPDSSSSKYYGVYWLDEAKNGFTKKYINSFSTDKACALDGDTWDVDCSAKTDGKDWEYFALMLGAFKLDELTTAFSNVELLDDDYVDQRTDDEYTGGGSTGPCWNSGIDSMAWVMCPVESNLTHFAKGLSGVIDTWLQVDSELYSTKDANGEETGAYIAWGFVRTIANTLMIVFMGVIIFSQLTGYGIDNYGIKKILPKFIVMALLINLSFFVCQVVVDLSNIVGNGIQSLFYGIGNQIVSQHPEVSTASSALGDFIGQVIPALYAAAAGGAVVIGAVSTISSAGSVLGVILVILMLLTILVAILMFFVSLGARIVIIIMCMVLAPLAFVCYILPNTKPIYKKWFDAFKTALIIYPICGGVIGIGYIIKAISVTSGGNLAFVVIAGLAPYLPFFMIPAMIKGAISALGTVGAALGSMGSTFKSGAGKLSSNASSMIKDSNSYKNAAAEAARRKQTNWANRVKNRLNSKEDGLKKQRKELNARDTRMRAYAQQTLDKQNAEDVAALKSSLSQKYKDAENLSGMRDELMDALKKYDENPNAPDATQQKNRINALTDLMVSRGGLSAAGDIAGAVNGAGLKTGGAAYQALRDNMSANRDFGSAMKSKRGGSMYDNINSLGSGSMAKSMATGSLSSAKDWTTQSASEINAAAAEAARIRDKESRGERLTDDETNAKEHFEAIAKEMVNTTDPNIRTNVLGDPDKRKAWENAVRAIPGYVDPSASNNPSVNSGQGEFKVGSARANDQFSVSIDHQGGEQIQGPTRFRPHVEPTPQQPQKAKPQSSDPSTPFHLGGQDG